MANGTIPVSNAAFNLFMGSFPNGESVKSVQPGLYRTDLSHLPSEGVVGNEYGTLLILRSDDSGYQFIMYIGLVGQSGVFSTYSNNWHQTST